MLNCNNSFKFLPFMKTSKSIQTRVQDRAIGGKNLSTLIDHGFAFPELRASCFQLKTLPLTLQKKQNWTHLVCTTSPCSPHPNFLNGFFLLLVTMVPTPRIFIYFFLSFFPTSISNHSLPIWFWLSAKTPPSTLPRALHSSEPHGYPSTFKLVILLPGPFLCNGSCALPSEFSS